MAFSTNFDIDRMFFSSREWPIFKQYIFDRFSFSLRFWVEDKFSQRRWRDDLDQGDQKELEGLGDGRNLSELVEVEDGDQEAQDQEVGDLHHPAGDLAEHAGNKPRAW